MGKESLNIRNSSTVWWERDVWVDEYDEEKRIY